MRSRVQTSLPAAAGGLAAEADDGSCATHGPAHAREFEALGDDVTLKSMVGGEGLEPPDFLGVNANPRLPGGAVQYLSERDSSALARPSYRLLTTDFGLSVTNL